MAVHVKDTGIRELPKYFIFDKHRISFELLLAADGVFRGVTPDDGSGLAVGEDAMDSPVGEAALVSDYPAPNVQPDEVVEGLDEVDGHFPEPVLVDRDAVEPHIAPDSEGVGEWRRQLVHVQPAWALPCLDVEEVAEHVVAHAENGGLQATIAVKELDVIKGVVVLLEFHVLEDVALAVGVQGFAVFPVGGVGDLLNAGFHDSVKVVRHLDEDVLPAAAILFVLGEYGVGSGARAGEEIKYFLPCINTCKHHSFYQVNWFWCIKSIVLSK